MNVGQIRQAVAGYLQVDESDLVKGVDLLLMALNNARKAAERLHDWDCQRVTVASVATGGTGVWQNAVLYGTETAVRLKTPETFYLQQGDALLPIHHMSRLHGANKARERISRRLMDGEERYARSLDLNVIHNYAGNLRLPNVALLHGPNYTIEPIPESPANVVVDGYRWLDDYTDDTDFEDFFTQDGHDYLMWAGIVECNYLVQAFIPQTEGNLSPPEKARDRALEGLIEHDNFIQETGRFPSFR